MSQRVVTTIQWASIVVGITGMTLDKLIPLNRAVAITAIVISFIAFATLVVLQIFYRDPNRFEGKEKVDLAWRTVLSGADHAVEVFAGDVSWARANKDVLRARTKAGASVHVLCKWPSTPILLDQVRTLFAAGVKVRYYDGDLVKVRGMVADAEVSPDQGTALTVVKTPKQRITMATGQSGSDRSFDYEARRYLPDRDLSYIAMLHQLFGSIWAGLPQGIIVDRRQLSTNDLHRILSQISHYRHLTLDDISLQNVSRASLQSCCRTVKTAKLPGASALIEGYRKYALDPFEPAAIESSGGRRLVLPPIVERQPGGALVVVDGMHRIYQLITHTDAQQLTCLVIDNAGPLPSDPVPFTDVRLSPTKLQRSDNFPNYRHERFRDIKAIDRYLTETGDR
ncbi:hypothetical protein GCM10011609_71020 [Lentzea pudingi]|uniref:Inactive HKD-Rease domain-containing protein n=2 Tax=Lentzea pudingi TaxID=1789439 RepID=A0ABQ2IM22_9PSEU|nr:hypothetical protein GCM10011609_71020 [Lentzea pudingi]